MQKTCVKPVMPAAKKARLSWDVGMGTKEKKVDFKKRKVEMKKFEL